MKVKSIVAAGFIAASALVASVLPAAGQGKVTARSSVSPGPGWENAGQDQYGATHWIKFLPKRVSSRATYLHLHAYPGDLQRECPIFDPACRARKKPLAMSVNCNTWETKVGSREWDPIVPGSWGDKFALKACKRN